jgi:hypothetical protein
MRADPIIVVGMHRSGTTLVSDILSRLGVFMGSRLESHLESVFFRDVNEWILEVAHGGWDRPRPLEDLVRTPETRRAITDRLKKQIRSLRFRLSYWGASGGFGTSRFSPAAWGWKEPRTTVTLPFWCEVFPDARYVYVYRNGIDVAGSLARRERARAAVVDNRYFSARCMDLDDAFGLWEEYNDMYLSARERYSLNQVLELQYEQIAESPEKVVGRLIDALALECSDGMARSAALAVRPGRGYAFLEDAELMRLYDELKSRPLMKKLGYGSVPSSERATMAGSRGSMRPIGDRDLARHRST